MPLSLVFAGLVLVGAAVLASSLGALRVVGARPSVARRLAGPPEVRVGHLLGTDNLPSTPVRVSGRIRCRDPLEAEDGERLVAFHRDVEVRIGGRWRSLERLRETRSFDLWDHDGSLPLDPAHAAEPLISIPKVWRGDPAQLEEPHASAAAQLAERYGPASAARAITRTINVTDRLLCLAQPGHDERGEVRLDPPDGGYLLTNLALPDAMRLLGGRHRRTAVAAVIGLGLATATLAIGVVGLLASALLGA